MGGRTDQVLAERYGLPPTMSDGEVAGCAMARIPIGGGAPEPCMSASLFVADLGVSGAGMPVCDAHAHQLVNRHRDLPGLPSLALHPLRSGVDFGIPAGYLGELFHGVAAGPDYSPGGGFRRGWPVQ